MSRLVGAIRRCPSNHRATSDPALRRTLIRPRLRLHATPRATWPKSAPWPRHRRGACAGLFDGTEHGADTRLTHSDALGHMTPPAARPRQQLRTARHLLCLSAIPQRNRHMPLPACRGLPCRLAARAGLGAAQPLLLIPRVAPRKCWPSTPGTLGVHSIALGPTSEQPVASSFRPPGLASLPWLTTRSRRAMSADDPPDRTTAEWLRHACRDDGVRRASTGQVWRTQHPGNTASPRVPSTETRCRMGMGTTPIMLKHCSRRRRPHDMH